MEYSVQISKTFCRWKGKAGRRLDVCLDALLSGYAVVLYVKFFFFFFFFPKKKKKMYITIFYFFESAICFCWVHIIGVHIRN